MTELALKIRDIGKTVKIDRVWLAIVAILVLLAAVNAEQARASGLFLIESLLEIAPYLLLAIAIAAYAGATGADGLIARIFHGRTRRMIVFAAIFGGLSPFCSCGVIPLIAALLAMGVPLSAVMAFWLASPIMDPSMFVLTMGQLGLPFAIGKTLAAVGLGLLGGFATLAVQNRGGFADPLLPDVGNGGCGGAKVRTVKEVRWAFWEEPDRRAKFGRESLSTTLFLGKWLALAFLLESLMLAYVPAELIVEFLGADSVWAIPLAVFTGAPAYLNGYAALPLVAGLIDMGTLPGAGMAFLVAGGVTSIPAAIAVFALVKRPVFLWYLALSVVGVILSGLLYQLAVG